jgi:predicted dithiol-disulfide oxidoreductase (DUF899 family)
MAAVQKPIAFCPSEEEKKKFQEGKDRIKRYPNGASPEYVQARQALLEAEWNLRNQIENVAVLRRQLPQGAVMKDYVFDGPNGTKVSLADLAADGRSTVIYHLMFPEKDEEPCSMCACFVDAQNGIGQHLDQVLNFAVIGKASIAKIEAYAAKRGWKNLKVLSSSGNDFNRDMEVENPDWAPDSDMPGLSVFKKGDDGKIRHVYSQTASYVPGTERGMDLANPLFNIVSAFWPLTLVCYTNLTI